MSAKYPRTPHAPNSPGGTADDKRVASLVHLVGRDLIISEKLDGSNLALTHDAVYARSHAGAPTHPSFNLAKAMHAELGWQVPAGMSVFGEWCFAVHSIRYTALPSYFFVFAVRDDATDEWLSWEEVEIVADELALPTTPVVWRGVLNDEYELEDLLEHLGRQPSVFGPIREGVVARLAGRFSDFASSTVKWVRAGHVQTEEHWMHGPIVRQRLRR